MTADPALTHLSSLLASLHDHAQRSITAHWPPTQRICSRTTRVRVWLGYRYAGLGVDPGLAHVLPILLVNLGPFPLEFCPAVTRLHVSSALCVSATDALYCLRTRAAASRIPPARSRSQELALHFRAANTARGHLFGCHEAEQAD